MLSRQVRTTRSFDEQGGISLLMLTVVLLTFLISTPLLFLGSAFCRQVSLSNSADLVAIGAAAQFLSDQPKPCEVAKRLANQYYVELLECQVQELSVLVKVAVSTPNFIQRIGVATLTAQAKAGL